MAVVLDGIRISSLSDLGDVRQKSDPVLRLEVTTDNSDAVASVYNGAQKLLSINLSDEDYQGCKASKQAYLINVQGSGVLLHFPSEFEMTRFENIVKGARHNASKGVKKSVFTERTDEASAAQYFQFYGYLSQQQNMMQDYIRTSTYQKAMLQNHEEFRDKVVLDVGAGSGILSFFAIQAGAKRVYAIEASSIAEHAKNLVAGNKLSDRIIVMAGKVEEVSLPEQVDIIISEPMGYMLFNERMLESYLHAKKWLRPGGNMFPTQGDIHIAPFTDDSLYMEQFTKANFWYQQSFHGVDLSPIREAALQEYLRQPIVDTFDIRICLAKSLKYSLNFLTTNESDLHRIEIPLHFTTHQAGAVHGLAFWFDVLFKGKMQNIWLSTSPTEPLTHWYQVRCLLRSPLYVKAGQVLKGKVILIANNRQSYDIDIELEAGNSGVHSTNRLDLKNPFFHYTGQQPQPPTGSQTSSPSDNYWSQLPSTGTINGYGEAQSNAGPGLAVQYVGQSNLIPLANTDPISHTGVLPGGATQRQQTIPIPSSVGVVMGTVAFNQMVTTSATSTQGTGQGANGYSPFGHGLVQPEGMQIGQSSGSGYN